MYQLGGTLTFEVFRDPFSDSKTREKDEAKKAREREPSSPTGDTPPAKKGAAGSLGAPKPSVLDPCCLWEISQSVGGVVLDVLIERMDEKDETGRTWEQIPALSRQRYPQR